MLIPSPSSGTTRLGKILTLQLEKDPRVCTLWWSVPSISLHVALTVSDGPRLPRLCSQSSSRAGSHAVKSSLLACSYCSLIFPKQRQQISLFVQKCSLYNFVDLTIRPNSWSVPKVCSQESLQTRLQRPPTATNNFNWAAKRRKTRDDIKKQTHGRASLVISPRVAITIRDCHTRSNSDQATLHGPIRTGI